jgi:hypothetical protein
MENKSHLQLIRFFDHYDKANPYHRAAVQELGELIPASLLQRKVSWFQTWMYGGKRQG